MKKTDQQRNEDARGHEDMWGIERVSYEMPRIKVETVERNRQRKIYESRETPQANATAANPKPPKKKRLNES